MRQNPKDQTQDKPEAEHPEPAPRPTLESIAKLRMIVWEMESEIGLAALGEHERDVLYAIWRIARQLPLKPASNVAVMQATITSATRRKSMAHGMRITSVTTP